MKPSSTNPSSLLRLISLFIVLLVTAAVMAGCAASTNPAPTNTPYPTFPFPGTATETPFLPADVTPTVTPTFTPTPFTCTEANGAIERRSVSLSDDRSLQYRVYLPPCYKQLAAESNRGEVCFPLLVLLHGQTYTDNQWERLGAGNAADVLITQQDTIPFIIVMPYEEDAFADVLQSSFPDDLTGALLSQVDEEYLTCQRRTCRAIGGISRGGGWALWIGLEHWDTFGIIGAHSTPVFIGTNSRLDAWLRSDPLSQQMQFFLDIGRNDPYYQYASEFHTFMEARGVAHEWTTPEGNHTDGYWEAQLKGYIDWYASAWSGGCSE